MYSRLYQNEKRNKKKTSPLTSPDEGALQRCHFTMQLKTLSQRPDLKTSLSQAERYGHHLDTIQCAGLLSATPIQMSVNEEEEKRISSMDLNTSKLNDKKPLLDKVLTVASLRSSNQKHQKGKNIKKEPKKHSTEKIKDKEAKAKKQHSDEHLKSHATNNSKNKATNENSRNNDPEVTRLLNKKSQNNPVGLGGIQEKSQEKIIAPPSTYDEKKSTPNPKVGTRSQYLNKREAMNIIGNNKEFAATQHAVKKVSIKDTIKSDSKAEDSKQQVKLKNAAELVRDQVIKEDRQVKEHIQAKLNLDPAIVAKQGGEQLILQKMQ